MSAYKNHKKFLEQVIEFKGVEKIVETIQSQHPNKIGKVFEHASNNPLIMKRLQENSSENIKAQMSKSMTSKTAKKSAKQIPTVSESETKPVFITDTKACHPDLSPDTLSFLPINKHELLSLFNEIEEDSLFRMNQIQEKELLLEKYKRSMN